MTISIKSIIIKYNWVSMYLLLVKGLILIAQSMTAYGRSTGSVNGKNVTVEIKSVNSRFFDPTIKITRNYSFLEEKIKSYIQSRISRGKVDFWLGIEVVENIGCNIMLDKAYAETAIRNQDAMRALFAKKK